MRAELMRYRNDSLSYLLTLLGLAFNAVLLIVIYSTKEIQCNDNFGFIIGVDTIFNIVFLLMSFYAAEKVKTYSKNWCWTCLVLGVLQLPRLLFPIALNNAGQLLSVRFFLVLAVIILSSGCLISACFISFSKSKKLHAYLNTIKEEVA